MCVVDIIVSGWAGIERAKKRVLQGFFGGGNQR